MDALVHAAMLEKMSISDADEGNSVSGVQSGNVAGTDMPYDADSDVPVDKENEGVERWAGQARSCVRDERVHSGKPLNQPYDGNNHPQSSSNHPPTEPAIGRRGVSSSSSPPCCCGRPSSSPLAPPSQ